MVDRYKNGTPAGRGWGVYSNVKCPNCSLYSDIAALIGTRGYTCPHCGDLDQRRIWLDDLPVPAGDTSTLLPIGWQHARLCMN
jgi:hypothetical protein